MCATASLGEVERRGDLVRSVDREVELADVVGGLDPEAHRLREVVGLDRGRGADDVRPALAQRQGREPHRRPGAETDPHAVLDVGRGVPARRLLRRVLRIGHLRLPPVGTASSACRGRCRRI
ncbi:MAG: hypothetical protein U5R31_01205 [Acidimicrobiia bacterium]|nr:hypothetical protein [Acidimicrobiia bacterium]